ncbi:DUF3429 family protein [Pelagibacterales bacterium SAG-MED31]|nr:DUF3429 family protein [Pelagibacterales bacterium SAG-MED31]
MYKNFNLQFFISYFGLIPYLIIIIDKFFLNQIDINILHSFSVFYSIIILVFIGSINWNFEKQIPKILILYGFSPSLFSVFFIMLYLYDYNVFNLLISFFLIQLLLDYFLIYKNGNYLRVFFLVRAPLTTLIVFSLIIIQ